jgi:hypothetical protein
MTRLGLILVCIPTIAIAQDSKLDLSQRFLLLATTKTSTMQKELDQAAAAGYRVLAGSRTRGAEAAIILEKIATPPAVYEYYVLATTRTSTMERELNDQAARGFRLLPRTMTGKDHPISGEEIFMLMEKAPGSAARFKYRLLATTRTGTLQKEMAQTVDDGYEVVGIVSRGEHIVILEKTAP